MKFKALMLIMVMLAMGACSEKNEPTYGYNIATYLREERNIDVRAKQPLIALNNFQGQHSELHGEFNYFLFGGQGHIEGVGNAATYIQFALRASNKLSVVEMPINKIDFQLHEQPVPLVKIAVASNWDIERRNKPIHWSTARKDLWEQTMWPSNFTTSELLSKYVTRITIFLTEAQFGNIAPMVK